MDQLKDLLREISAEEREEALQYYEDYFADAERNMGGGDPGTGKPAESSCYDQSRF